MYKQKLCFDCLLFVSFLLSSCQATGDRTLKTESDKSAPEFVLNEAKITIIEDDLTTIEVKELAYFPVDGRQEFKNVRFIQRATEGKVKMKGNAQRLVMYQNKDILMEGDTYIDIRSADTSLKGTYFFWNNNEHTITGSSTDKSYIEKQNESKMQGVGLIIDTNAQVVRFSSNTQGFLVPAKTEIREKPKS